MDIRTSLSAMWQLIGSLCQSATNTINDAFNQFANSAIITRMALPEELLKAKMQAALDLMRRTASSAWMKPLTAIHRITQANGFMTGLLTNYIAVQPGIFTEETRLMWTLMNTYILKGATKSCSCQNDGSCPMAAGLYLYNMRETYGLYDLNILQPNSTLSGIVIDCLPLQMTLASSLECFYNESCMNILFSIYSKTVNISILDASSPSRFLPTTNIEFLINELFIEEIFNEMIYKKYYLECAPIYCTFSYARRFYWIYVVTTLIALLGGLYTTLHLITPYLIDFILFLKKRRSVQIESQQNESKIFNSMKSL
ncbi:unnamed protein product [Rotaria sp. Silwood1]|nr:unnamed protein product [Rotaria sp. Silwood1]